MITVDLVVDRDARGDWPAVAARILSGPGRTVRLRARAPDLSLPGAVETLMRLEAMLFGRGKGAQPAVRDAAVAPFDPADATAELVINLTRSPLALPGRRVWQPRFGGALGDLALADALLAKSSPLIEIEDVGAATILATGRASLEVADSLAAGMVSVVSRAALLLGRCLSRFETGTSTTPVRAVASAVTPLRAGRALASGVVSRAVRSAYRLCFRAPHWRVGWRRTERSVWERRDLGGTPWTVLPDPGHRFYADPFALRRRGRDFLFFEDLDHRAGKGIISCAEIAADGTSGPVMPVLEEAWHLSYPFLIEHEGEIYMIPEGSVNDEVAIYRAVDFPLRWERHAQLLSGVEAADATIVRHGGLWWMFAVVRPGLGGYSDTLKIWSAPDLFGPWTPHVGNPLIVDPAQARPAGRFVRRGGILMRPVQDCTNGYGAALGLARIDRLDVEGFVQTIEDVLMPGSAWPGRKLHTLNAAGTLETIDGCVLRPKADAANRWMVPRYRPA